MGCLSLIAKEVVESAYELEGFGVFDVDGSSDYWQIGGDGSERK
jgi:hypothetical protein